MKYTKIPSNTFQKLALNAGVIGKNFDPETGQLSNQIGATTGGISFTATPAFTDFGDDIDNCPKNMMELKHLDSWDVQMSGTLLTADPEIAKLLIAAGDVSGNKITPRKGLHSADFNDLWFVCDYSDVNDGSSAGFVAIKVLNALNTGGFQLKSTNNGKDTFAFTFTGHVSMSAQDVVPFEVYIKGSGAGSTPYVTLDTHVLNLTVNEEVDLTYDVNPSDASITWASSASGKASVTNGKVKGLEAGSTVITASITDSGVTYNDTCTVIVTSG